jgi:precorrin-6A/cobalt-precorrin-6A reductase
MPDHSALPTRRSRTAPCRVLLLGGTGEAAELARLIPERFGDEFVLTTSLAGRTEPPMHIRGDVRIGGFGGVEGLTVYLRDHAVDLVLDATHPFADQISAHARLACEAAAIDRLMLVRPMWRRDPRDRWIEVADLAGAAAIVGKVGRRAWLTIGISEIGAFANVADVWFLVRSIHAPSDPLPLKRHEILIGRGPFSLREEQHVLQRHAIDVLVCKASGGAATEAKLVAAREAVLPVIMVRRPAPEPGAAVVSVEAAMSWLDAFLARRAVSTTDPCLS